MHCLRPATWLHYRSASRVSRLRHSSQLAVLSFSLLFVNTVQAEDQQAKSDELKSKWDRLKELETTIREKPTEPEPILEMGRLYQELEQPEAAAGAYQMILSIDPQHVTSPFVSTRTRG